MAEKKAVKSFLWGALAGAVTGAVAGLLFAPKKGSELRKDIADTAHTVGEKTAEIGRKAGATASSLARRSGDWAEGIRSRFGKRDKAEIASIADDGSAEDAADDQ
ncbi:YtxH domain-containing protein [Cohnella zeiphila]|uniref:YtxH domain-containing protein n=1 Tax=Cohnella zeiphila TaxID=2761120 RepID=A0A7X0SRZ1_9BACL|nr:YtxH domain-containing protein [Cohnella zeiphila]MBB6735042.1 YtxH domain-containing protein [Cohnella zeiphila]